MTSITFSQPGTDKVFGCVIKREELLELHEKGLIRGAGYILLCLKIDAQTYENISVNDFCGRWGISKNSYYKASAILQDWGILAHEKAAVIVMGGGK